MSMKRHTKALLVILLAGGVTSCSKDHEPHPRQKDVRPPVQVSGVRAETMMGLRTQEIPGTVRSENETVISAKIQGQVESLAVVPGSRVDKGELLLTLKADEMKARVERAKAKKQQAELDFNRVNRLIKNDAISQREYDTALSALNSANAALLEAETFLDYTTITAPFSGIVSEKMVEVGDLAAPGRNLLSMFDPRVFRLEVKVPESLAKGIQIGDTFSVRMETLGKEIETEVSEISPLADPTSRTVLVKLAIAPETGVQTGQFGRMLIPVEGSSMLTVPQESVIKRGQLEFVFVIQGEAERRAHLRLIKTGRRQGVRIEVLSGLEPGEAVITDGLDQLDDGQRVIW